VFDFLIVIGSIIDVILSEINVSKKTARPLTFHHPPLASSRLSPSLSLSLPLSLYLSFSLPISLSLSLPKSVLHLSHSGLSPLTFPPLSSFLSLFLLLRLLLLLHPSLLCPSPNPRWPPGLWRRSNHRAGSVTHTREGTGVSYLIGPRPVDRVPRWVFFPPPPERTGIFQHSSRILQFFCFLFLLIFLSRPDCDMSSRGGRGYRTNKSNALTNHHRPPPSFHF